MADIRISGCNGFYQVIPVTEAGEAFVAETCDVPSWAYIGKGFGCDSGSIVDGICCGAIANGLEVEGW